MNKQKFVKKPIVIEAMQYDGKNAEEIQMHFGIECIELLLTNDTLVIYTPEGDMKASPGDWIIKGIKGEFYPCKPDIFELTYQLVLS